MKKKFGIWVAALALGCSGSAQAASLYNQDFSTDTNGWSGATLNLIPTDTDTATATGGAFTNFGGYNFGAGNAIPTVFQEYYTSLDIYLDLAGGGWANNTRFDWSSAINNSSGTHNRDFIFNAGFYNDATGPGVANTNRFIVSASNTSQPGSAYAKNPARGPIAISASGWYTFEHHFYNNAGVLAVDMSIYDSANSLVNQWSLSDPSDLIAGIGGNRYGWFDYNQFSGLEIDNARLDTAAVVPIPGAAGLGLLGMGLVGYMRRRKNFVA